MIRNFVTGSIRNAIRNRGFAMINILGLAVGLASGIYVIHYARFEYSYDRFHRDAERIYRLSTARIRDGVETTTFAGTYAGVAPMIRAEYPEVESATRMFRRWRGGVVSYEDVSFREQHIFHVDSGFFDVFSFPIIEGHTDDLRAPGIAFIEETTAKKYFHAGSAIGKRIRFASSDGFEDYEVRGVFRCPQNSSLKLNFLFSYHNLDRIFGTEHLTNWSWVDFHTFLKLKDGTDPSHLQLRFPDLLKMHRGDRASSSRLLLQPLPELYLNSRKEFETGITGDEVVVRVLLALGCVIIVIVSLNFINLTTAQAMVRAREVGIRKTLGSSRRGLIVQFLVEAGITCFVALLVCTLFLWIAIPFLDTLTERQTDFSDFFLSDLWKYLLTFQLFGTLVIGIYPAVKLSSFRPVEVLKGLLVPKAQGSFFREIFVGFQALVSFSLVAGILIIIDQVRFIRSKELGIDINQVLVIRTPQGFENLQEYLTSMNTLKSELMKDSRIASASISADSPGEPVNWIGGARKAGLPAADNISVYRSVIDRDYINTLGISLIAGTNFQTERSERDVMLNQSAVRALGFESEEAAIGQILSFAGDHDFTVTGVVEDFHQVSPREMVLPTTYHCNLEAPRLMFVRFNTSDAATVIEMAQGSFEGLFPSEPFDYYFLDEFFDRQYTLERKLSSILGTFCVLAVVVSSLGLLGLTWFRLSRQKKALAIRKIVGSGELRLFYDASARLMRTTLIGCFVGIPVTWLVMTRWLQTFSLHTEPKSWQFGLALMTSLFIAVLTISNYTLKIIRTNPVLHLRQD